MHQWPANFDQYAQIDVLHLARKLWKRRLASRRLGDLEVEILGAHRTSEEVPGYLIPEMYIEYLQTNNAEPLKGVFYHNEIDILAMASLMTHMGHLLNDPVALSEHDLDHVRMTVRVLDDAVALLFSN